MSKRRFVRKIFKRFCWNARFAFTFFPLKSHRPCLKQCLVNSENIKEARKWKDGGEKALIRIPGVRGFRSVSFFHTKHVSLVYVYRIIWQSKLLVIRHPQDVGNEWRPRYQCLSCMNTSKQRAIKGSPDPLTLIPYETIGSPKLFLALIHKNDFD